MKKRRVRVWLSIDETLYLVEWIEPQFGSGVKRAWRLTKEGGENYVVAFGHLGYECSCPDWIARRQRVGQECKHISAAREGRLFG